MKYSRHSGGNGREVVIENVEGKTGIWATSG
jgi:hypothetical protein